MAVVDQPGRPPLDEIVFRSYPDARALEAALAGGAVDVAAGFAPGDYERVQAIGGASAIHANDGDQWTMQLRVGEPGLRQAIAQAIDRDTLVQTVAHGVGRAQTIPVVARAAAWQLPDAVADAITSALTLRPRSRTRGRGRACRTGRADHRRAERRRRPRHHPRGARGCSTRSGSR